MKLRNFIPVYGLIVAAVLWRESHAAHERRLEAIRIGYYPSSAIWETLDRTFETAGHLVVSMWATILELWTMYALWYYWIQ